MKTSRALAEEMTVAAIKSVDPYHLIFEQIRLQGDILSIQDKEQIDLSAYNNIYLLGAGKGTAPMAKALEEILGGRLHEGFIVVKYGHGLLLKRVAVQEAGHPLPDENSLIAGEKMLALAGKADKDDLVFVLISGGASALVEALLPGISLQSLSLLNEQLLACGADIGEINSVRKTVSLVKGGGLIKKIHPAKTIALILSDVVGDPLEVIGSGPTVIDKSAAEKPLQILQKYYLVESLPVEIVHSVKNSHAHEDANGLRVKNFIIGNNLRALRSAEKIAEDAGYNTLILSDRVEGESREIAKLLAGIIKTIQSDNLPLSPPACVLLGGETTVTLKGTGKGGRNQETVLSLLTAMKNIKAPFYFCSIGTDGSDGPTDAAGAWVDEKSFKKALELKINPADYLKNNDSYHFFNKLGQLIKTGPTMTNVMDIMFVIIER